MKRIVVLAMIIHADFGKHLVWADHVERKSDDAKSGKALIGANVR